MSDTSPTLHLPLIQPSQAQKHVTHNEAIMALDHLLHLRLHGVSLTAPPDAAEIGQVFDVGSGAGTPWEGKDGLLAIRTETGWTFETPQDGWIAVVLPNGMPYLRQNGA